MKKYNKIFLIGYHISNNPEFINYMKQNIENKISELKEIGFDDSHPVIIDGQNYIKNSYVLYPLISFSYIKGEDKLNISRFDSYCTSKSSGHHLK